MIAIRCNRGRCEQPALKNSEWCRVCWQRWWCERLSIAKIKKALFT